VQPLVVAADRDALGVVFRRQIGASQDPDGFTDRCALRGLLHVAPAGHRAVQVVGRVDELAVDVPDFVEPGIAVTWLRV